MNLVPNHRFGLEFDPSHLVRQYIDPYQTAWDFRDRILAVHAKDTEIIQPVLAKVGIHGEDWWRYRIPGQGLIDWPQFITVLLQIELHGGMAVEHEDPFWGVPHGDTVPDMAPERNERSFWPRVSCGSICRAEREQIRARCSHSLSSPVR